MENASKALLIAGAILICILLIGVGMLVFNKGNESMQGGFSAMDQNAKQAFNAPFVQYEGKKSGANVRALIGNVISSNSTNKDTDAKIVSITGDETFKADSKDLKMNEMSAYRAKINTGAYYNIVVKYNDDGLVNEVEIKKQ